MLSSQPHSHTPPETLFHYTSQAGLIGILESNCIWATKIHYLNDHSEYQLALHIAQSELSEALSSESDALRRKKIECLLRNVPSIEHMNVCVVSFSAEGDLLSQWRAYAAGSGGFSVGFRTDTLVRLAQQQHFALVKCEYNEERQRFLIKRLIEESLNQEFNMRDGYIDPNRPNTLVVLKTGGDFTENLAKLAPVIKNNAFREEEEWRLVSTRGLDVMSISFRPGRSTITPYYKFYLSDDRVGHLRSVTVGPTPNRELAEVATKSLLTHWRAIRGVQVLGSDVPYRNW
jgi:hypothetical protein